MLLIYFLTVMAVVMAAEKNKALYAVTVGVVTLIVLIVYYFVDGGDHDLFVMSSILGLISYLIVNPKKYMVCFTASYMSAWGAILQLTLEGNFPAGLTAIMAVSTISTAIWYTVAIKRHGVKSIMPYYQLTGNS